MYTYKCTMCGYVYDPEQGDLDGGVRSGTLFENIPVDWCCPICGAGKDLFESVEDETEDDDLPKEDDL